MAQVTARGMAMAMVIVLATALLEAMARGMSRRLGMTPGYPAQQEAIDREGVA